MFYREFDSGRILTLFGHAAEAVILLSLGILIMSGMAETVFCEWI